MNQSVDAKQKYKELVDTVTPNSKIFSNCVKAFVVGGIICCIGQFFNNVFLNMGYSLDKTSMLTAIVLIFLAALFTGLGVYDTIGKFAGAGSVVPITGFANSMVAPALEFKKEGFIFGVGAKLFIIAGPVIVYGVVTSIVVGLIYYLTLLY